MTTQRRALFRRFSFKPGYAFAYEYVEAVGEQQIAYIVNQGDWHEVTGEEEHERNFSQFYEAINRDDVQP